MKLLYLILSIAVGVVLWVGLIFLFTNKSPSSLRKGLLGAARGVRVTAGASSKEWYLIWEAPSGGAAPTAYGWKISDSNNNILQQGSGNVLQVLLDMTKLKYDTQYTGIVWASNDSGTGPTSSLPFILYQLPTVVSVAPVDNNSLFMSANNQFYFDAVITLADVIPDIDHCDVQISYNGKNYAPTKKEFANTNRWVWVSWCDPSNTKNCSLEVDYNTKITLNVTATNAAGTATYTNDYTSPQSPPNKVANLALVYQ